ncbi:hypothetical protein GYMLUDRAFT_491509 [Collybiopsis luxurians FD-317 M1]|uniref:Uncharacterized protein n=1 Tax=Collybiopsis luxurians FD-317 M1 TaxID=944289 RepID=A0A0D0C3T5_9AGAR|nr:hypothetical protein GYMLUDRAFT_491509 [Collybiopsis luxurians FD-317 M1]
MTNLCSTKSFHSPHISRVELILFDPISLPSIGIAFAVGYRTLDPRADLSRQLITSSA